MSEADEFLRIARELRELGCTSFEWGVLKATFATRTVLVERDAKPESKASFLPSPTSDEPADISPDRHETQVELRRRERAAQAAILMGGRSG